MSKIGAWVLGMQEDAVDMTREQFILKHGEGCVDVWEEVRNPINEPDDPFDIS